MLSISEERRSHIPTMTSAGDEKAASERKAEGRLFKEPGKQGRKTERRAEEERAWSFQSSRNGMRENVWVGKL